LIEKHRGVAIDWVFDSRNNRDYRNTILNGYKHGRVQQFDPSVRRSVLQQVIQWLRDSNESVVTLDRFEADDAMADLVRHYASQCKRVLLYSRDSDLAQLQYIPSAQEYLRFNPPRDPPCGTIEFWWNTKAAIGDIGDNVHGLHGIGAKHATLESGKRVATAAAMESVGSGAHVQHSVARVIERNVRCVRL
jgi:5'-3' exonuclease